MKRTDGPTKNKGLVSIAGVVVCMHQTIHVFHRKINRKITQLCDTENTHNNNMRSRYNSVVVVVLLMTSVSQRPGQP